jgi:hypothetical protein
VLCKKPRVGNVVDRNLATVLCPSTVRCPSFGNRAMYSWILPCVTDRGHQARESLALFFRGGCGRRPHTVSAISFPSLLGLSDRLLVRALFLPGRFLRAIPPSSRDSEACRFWYVAGTLARPHQKINRVHTARFAPRSRWTTQRNESACLSVRVARRPVFMRQPLAQTRTQNHQLVHSAG